MRIRLRFFVSPGLWKYEPKSVWVHYPIRPEPPNDNEDDILMGLDFEQGAELLILPRYTGQPTMEFIYDADNRIVGMDAAPWIEIRVENYGIIPDGLQGAGNKAWTFIDEIIIE